MKILIIHNNYQSRFIGGEDVVFRREVDALKESLGAANVFEYSVCNDDLRLSSLIFSIWFSNKHYRKVYEIVKENKIDLVHVHNFYPLLTPSVFRAAKSAGAKTVQTLHNFRWWCLSGIFYRTNSGACELCAKKKFAYPGIFYKCYRGSFLQSLLTASVFWFYKATKQDKKIDRFFVLSQFEKNKILELGADPVKIILKPNFIEMGVAGSSEGKKDFIYVGKLDESKGVLELLDAWKGLDDNYVLKLVGAGELDEQIKAMNLKNVHLLGRLDNKATLQEIAKSKYLISSSLMYETFGLTVVEAMSVGTPVIAFKIGTRTELIEDGQNGFLSERHDLKNIIKKAYDYKNYPELSINAKASSDNYLKEKIVQGQIEIYKKILSSEL